MSNSPTPPAQDGERERLVANARKAVRCLYIAVDECVARDCSAAVNAALDTQSAELAALRAQVEGLRSALELSRYWLANCMPLIAPDTEHPLPLPVIDAALAPPQPVAKEK